MRRDRIQKVLGDDKVVAGWRRACVDREFGRGRFDLGGMKTDDGYGHVVGLDQRGLYLLSASQADGSFSSLCCIKHARASESLARVNETLIKTLFILARCKCDLDTRGTAYSQSMWASARRDRLTILQGRLYEELLVSRTASSGAIHNPLIELISLAVLMGGWEVWIGGDLADEGWALILCRDDERVELFLWWGVGWGESGSGDVLHGWKMKATHSIEVVLLSSCSVVGGLMKFVTLRLGQTTVVLLRDALCGMGECVLAKPKRLPFIDVLDTHSGRGAKCICGCGVTNSICITVGFTPTLQTQARSKSVAMALNVSLKRSSAGAIIKLMIVHGPVSIAIYNFEGDFVLPCRVQVRKDWDRRPGAVAHRTCSGIGSEVGRDGWVFKGLQIGDLHTFERGQLAQAHGTHRARDRAKFSVPAMWQECGDGGLRDVSPTGIRMLGCLTTECDVIDSWACEIIMFNGSTYEGVSVKWGDIPH
ncbi:hypothetical protein Tco_0731927 [Tanacetum coccineum]